MHRAASQFCERFGLRLPILLALMAGACPTSLSIAVANAGSMGACAALLFGPDEMKTWAQEFRAGSTGSFQINLWIPDPAPLRNAGRCSKFGQPQCRQLWDCIRPNSCTKRSGCRSRGSQLWQKRNPRKRQARM
jgi:NAD(P)H-dependent flavin oxidoreductase YrpB (nitropropane dioxygenase family)